MPLKLSNCSLNFLEVLTSQRSTELEDPCRVVDLVHWVHDHEHIRIDIRNDSTPNVELNLKGKDA